MKAKLVNPPQTKSFHPYTIEFTVESEDEALSLLNLLNGRELRVHSIRKPTQWPDVYDLWDEILHGLEMQGMYRNA